MKVTLTAVTQPVIKKPDGSTMTADELIVYAARVSNPSNQMNTETGGRLLKFCLRNKHWSVFETASMTVEVQTSRAIAAQILRHRSFTFQEFCVSGNTRIKFDLPGAVANGKRRAMWRTIKSLHDRQKAGLSIPSQIRVWDEDSNTFVSSRLKEVFYTGKKSVFKITLNNGKYIECTKDHKFLTKNGFRSLDESVGLTIIGSKAVIDKNVEFACNGIPLYQDKDWLLNAKERSIEDGSGLDGIADKAGIGRDCIRKWLKKFGIQFTKMEVSKYSPIWNKGKTGYSIKPHSIETIQKMRKAAKRGSDSNLWRGGASRSERQRIADWCATIRAELLIKANYKCEKCNSSLKLELHHVQSVATRPDLAYEKSNIQVVCEKCHDSIHSTSGEYKSWREKGTGNTLTVSWSKIEKVEYIGEVDTYDLEVFHKSHNYIANGIVTHNSQRYSTATTVESVEFRMKGSSNRQGSIDEFASNYMSDIAAKHIASSFDTYNDLIGHGVAPECARMVLPLCTQTTLYMTGNARSWIHYLEQRTSAHAQKEHRLVALEIEKIFNDEFPSVAEAMRESKL